MSAPACPQCGAAGTPVATVTVRSLALPELQDRIDDAPWHLCLSPDCDIAYFEPGGHRLRPAQLTAPLWFKAGAHPRYACYCNKVTEEEVRRMVREKGVTEMPQIIRLLRDEVQSDCRHRNPFGVCCRDRFHQVVRQALEE